jgi:predicted transcriptional regulator
MSNELDEATETAILTAIKDLISKVDANAVEKATKEQTKAINSVQGCLNKIKMQLNTVQAEQKAFHEARRDRSENCDKIHADFEQRLRDAPNSERCLVAEKHLKDLQNQIGEVSERRVEIIEIQIGKITPFMYKVAGAAIVLSIVITPIIGAIVGFIAKKIGG